MEFGVYLNQYGDDRAAFGFDEMLDQAALVERLGYDTVAVGERHFYGDGFFDPRTSLAALGTATSRVDVVANILVLPIYHPIHLAECVTGLDHLTDGRTRWGVSLGYRESELRNFGVEMDERVSRFLEALSVVKRLLSGERFSHDGRHFRFEDAFVRPTPVQEPRPPILGGGSADAAIERAARRCDGFTAAITDPETLAADVERYRGALADAGKDPDEGDVTIMVDGYVAETTEAAYEALDPYLLDLTEQYIRWGNPEFDGRPSWEDVEDGLLVGTPTEVRDRVETYREIGVDHLLFRTQFPGMSQRAALDSVRRFGEEVLPAFA